METMKRRTDWVLGPVAAPRRRSGRRVAMIFIGEWEAARMRLTGAAGRSELRQALAQLRDTYNFYNRTHRPLDRLGAALDDALEDLGGPLPAPLVDGVALLVRTEREDAVVQVVAVFYGDGDPRNTTVAEEDAPEAKAIVRGPAEAKSAPLLQAARDTSGPVLP